MSSSKVCLCATFSESLNGKLRGRIEADDRMGACFQQLRKQSDLQLIRCVQDNVRSQRSYFVKPPLSGWTLFFRQPEMERDYRRNAHRLYEKRGDPPPTLATSRFNTYFDVIISFLVRSCFSGGDHSEMKAYLFSSCWAPIRRWKVLPLYRSAHAGEDRGK